MDPLGPLLVEIADQSIGSPIIHSTKRGLRRIPPLVARKPPELGSVCGVTPRTTRSVSVVPVPEFLPLSGVQLPATPDAVESRAVGVGRSTVGN